jgi:hypothetical protein
MVQMKKSWIVLLLIFSGCVIDGANKPTYELETVGNIALDPKNPEEFEAIGLRLNFKSKW